MMFRCAAMVCLVTGIFLAVPVVPTVGAADRVDELRADELRVVDCLLPAQLRRLGGRTTYLAAREPIKTTIRDCEKRGGEYVLALVWPTQKNLEIWRPKARDGDPEAQTSLGELHEKGVDGQPDYDLAALWYRRAAKQGYARARFNLASLHERGLGVPLDPDEARRLYALAAGLDPAAPAKGRSRVRQSSQALAEARAALAAQTRDLERADAELDAARSSVEGLRARIRDLEARTEPAAQSLETDLADSRALLAERDRQIARLRASLATAQAESAARLTQALTALEQGKSGADAQDDALRRALAEAQGAVSAAQARLRDAQRREAEAQQAMDRLTRERATLAARLDGLTGALNANRRVQDDLRAELKRKDEVLSEKQVEIAGLQGTVDGLRAEVARGLRSGETALFKMAGSAASGHPQDDSLSRLRAIAQQVFGTYHALVIGNNDHKHNASLRTAIRDAQDMASILEQDYGFKVRVLTNATRTEILTAINDYRRSLTERDNFLIYYAGHGELDTVNQRGHWLPVDADPDNPANWLSDVEISDHLNIMSVRHAMVISDSCYSGILTRSGLKGLRPGMSDESRRQWLKEMAERRVRVAFSSGGLKPVLDGGGGRNSIFAKALFEALRGNDGILEGYELYRQTAELVNARASRHNFEQVPQYGPMRHTGHETGDFFFLRQ